MKMPRAIAILALAVATCSVPTASGTDGVNPPCCVARAMQYIPPGHKVTLLCRDGSRSAGRITAFDSMRGTLLFQPTDARAPMRTLPATDVVRLEWRESGKPSFAAGAVGFVLGGLIGLGVSLWTNPVEHHRQLSSESVSDAVHSISSSIGITALGAGLGTGAGLLASASSHHIHAVDCRDDH
jgi:hypothetical protein